MYKINFDDKYLKLFQLLHLKINTNVSNSRSSDRHGTKSAPTNNHQIDLSKHSPDSSIDNAAEQDDLLLLDQPSYNDLQGDIDDNISVRS